MGMTSYFRIGSAVAIAQALRQNAAACLPQEESVSSGLFPDDLDAVCRILGALRSEPVGTFACYCGEPLNGSESDDEESGQVVRLNRTFVSLFGTLTDAEAGAISTRLRQEQFAEAQETYKRQSTYGATLRAIFSRRSEFYGYVVVPPFLWFVFRRVLVVIGAISFMLAVDLILRPWLRRREARPPEWPDDDYQGWLLDMAAICRRAEAQKKDLIYDWSL